MRNRNGFTLIELLVVVAIIGILAAIAIPKYNGAKQTAYRAMVIADLSSLRTAQESFFADSGRYATLTEIRTRIAPSDGLGTPTIIASTSFWSATLTHPQVPGMLCGIAVSTANPVSASAGEGDPFCK
jgi:prepilin-type N-terminal cleavage/methylation domain-containing protein